MQSLHPCRLGLGLATAFLLLSSAPAAQNPWGLRNIEFVDEWCPAEFGAEFSPHGAGNLAFWTFWGDLQATAPACVANPPCPGTPCGTYTYTFSLLDKALAFAAEIDAAPVIVFHLNTRPPTFGGPGGAFWGMTFALDSQPLTGPIDLVVPPGTGCLDPQASYSNLLYCVSHAMAEHIASGTQGPVYMRFYNEAWGDWPLGTDWDENLRRYLASYLTFRRAILDVQAETSNPNIQFLVSHGSLPRGRITPRALFQEGEDEPSAQPAIIQLLDSLIERDRCAVGENYLDEGLVAHSGDPAFITNWVQAEIYAGPDSEYNQKLDAWLDSYVEWTALCWDGARPIFDFTTAHPHGKPALVHYDRQYFDQWVSDAMEAAMIAGTPPPWVAAEVAFQLSDQVNWGVYPLPGDGLDRFIAEDLARKWCALLDDEHYQLFCSPIVAGPPNYRGLYRNQPQKRTSCGPLEPSQPLGPVCVTGGLDPMCAGVVEPQGQTICEDHANEVFKVLHTKIGDPTSTETLGTPEDAFSHYRYHRPNKVVDAIWRNVLQDADTTASNVKIVPPASYNCAKVYDVFGVLKQDVWFGSGKLTVTSLGQGPRIIVWSCKLQPL